MPDRNEPSDKQQGDITGIVNLGMRVAMFLSAYVYPFCRKGIGRDGLGSNVALAGLFMLAFGIGTESYDVLIFFGLWAIAVGYQAQHIDKTQHSRYRGWPALACFIIRTKNEGWAKLVEGVLGMWAGGFLMAVSPVAGTMVMLGSLSLLGMEAVEQAVIRSRCRRMHDSKIAFRQRADAYRSGDW
jgi:hypothetical protein